MLMSPLCNIYLVPFFLVPYVSVCPAASPLHHPHLLPRQTQDMEEYLDCLLVRIMESSPQLLQSPTKPAGSASKYGPRAT